MQATYNPLLVALSIAVAVMVSYTALSLAARVAQANATQVRFWLIGGAIAMGVGIWSMHFIGMMAFSLPMALRYNVATTLMSLAIAIGSSGCAIRIAGGTHLGWRRLAGGALLMGSGICAMHYCGMRAIQVVPTIDYDPMLVAASMLIAVAASFAALWLAFNLRTGHSWQMMAGRLGAALLMGTAISGMHYTGMAASRFSRGSYCIGGVPIDNQWLAMLVGLITVALLAITLITTVFDAHMKSQTAGQAKRLSELNAELQLQAAKSRITEERLRQISDSIPALIAYWDRDGICRFANRAHFDRLGLHPEQLVGKSLDEVFGPGTIGSNRYESRRARIDAALRGERQQFDQTDVDADGAVRHSQSEFLPHWHDDQVMGFYAFIVDITPRKIAESRLAQQEARLSTTSRMGEIGGWELERGAAAPIWSDMVYQIHDLPVELHTQFFKTEEFKAKLSILARVDLKHLRYRKADGRNNNTLTIVGGVFDRNGNYVTGNQKVIEMKLKDQTLETMPESGITVKSTLDIASGSYVVRLVVRDSEGQAMSAQNSTVEIP